jgi:UDP-3-O-[3-hydroxymyristoyl] glucosamine N-acyltransferase
VGTSGSSTSGTAIGTKAVYGQTGVTKSVEGGKSYFGTQLKNQERNSKKVANIKKFLYLK